MANKKTNKTASVNPEAKTDVVAAPAVVVKEDKKVEAAPVQEVKKEEAKPAAEKKAAPKAEKKPAAKKPAAKKTAPKAEKKAAAKTEKKPAAKKAAPKTEKKPAAKKTEEKAEQIIIEIGKGYDSAEIIEMCKAAYKAENPRKQIRTIKVYVNVAESKAYYIVNEKSEGLFCALN